jgi:hypothetical protein
MAYQVPGTWEVRGTPPPETHVAPPKSPPALPFTQPQRSPPIVSFPENCSVSRTPAISPALGRSMNRRELGVPLVEVSAYFAR